MTMVKICGLTDTAAVRAALDAGADAIGFVFAPSVRQVDPEQAKKLAADIPDDVLKVAVMKNPESGQVMNVLNEFKPDVLQTDVKDFQQISLNESVIAWPVYREGYDEPSRQDVGDFLYEGKKSGSGETVDWQVAARFARHGRMILAGGLSAANVGKAINVVRPYGVDVSSAVEDRPGHKDPDMIRDFISAVRKADSQKEVVE